MFPDGKPLAVAPNTSTYSDEDMSVCNKLNKKRKQLILEKFKQETTRKLDVKNNRKKRLNTTNTATMTMPSLSALICIFLPVKNYLIYPFSDR